MTTAEAIAKLEPAFSMEDGISAGNAPDLNAAGAAIVVSHTARAERQGPVVAPEALLS